MHGSRALRCRAVGPTAVCARVPRRHMAVHAQAARDPAPIKVLGISGSLGKNSANTGLLQAAARRMPAGASMEMADVGSLPLYNDDLWQGKDDDSALPEPIRRLRAQVAAADVVVFGCPEYNGSVTPALKNALDWGSKKPCVYSGKVACVLGAGGGAGTARAQMHLYNIASFLNITIPGYPNGCLQINRYAPGSGIDMVSGQVTDKELEDRIAATVANTIEYARTLKQAAQARQLVSASN